MKKTVAPIRGNMDLENDPLAIKQGDYRDALDVTPISDGNGNTTSYEPVVGNEFAFDLGEQFAQKKILQFTLSAGADSYTLAFRRQNYIIIGTTTFAQNANSDITVDNAVTAILADIPDAVVTFDYATVTVNVSIEPSGNGLYWDWYVVNSGSAIATFIELQEAIDLGSAGQFKPMGSNDLLGDLFVWSATVGDLAEDLPITAVSDDGTGLVVLQVFNHGLSGGEVIKVSGVTDNLGNNLTGEWIVEPFIGSLGNVDANLVILYGSAYDAPYVLSNATITANYRSVGQITVAKEDVFLNTTDAWSLIRSKKLNFRVKKQVDTYVETDQKKKSLYFTDKYNPIRAMYYTGDYVTNGFLSFAGGTYDYLTLYDESKLIISDSNLTVEYTGTLEGVGQLKSGDYRYTVQLETENGSQSGWMPLTNVVNVYSALFNGNRFLLMGDADGTTTNKSNTISVSGIPTGLFKYINLACVIYQGIGNAGLFISRNTITSDTMTLNHTGYESAQDVDLGTLNSATADYQTAGSIDVLNNKMIISNLTTSQVIDFSAFFESLEHTLEKELIPSVGDSTTTAFDNLQFGEYYDPLSTYGKKTFVDNEIYRFGARVKLKGGRLMPNIFWIDDIRFDTSATNVTTPNRRVAGLTNYKLVDFGGTGDVYVTKVNFSNIDWNYQIDGVRLVDLVERIYIYQVEMIDAYKEILGSGISILFKVAQYINMGVAGGASGFAVNSLGYYISDNGALGQTTELGEFNGFSGNSQFLAFPDDYLVGGTITEGQKYASFYSPDEYFGNTDISYQAGDTLLVYEPQQAPILDSNQTTQSLGANAFKGRYIEIFGNDGADPTACVLDDVAQVFRGGNHSFDGTFAVYKTARLTWTDTSANNYNVIWEAPASPVCYYTTGFPINSGGNGYAQYYRPKGVAKFGDKRDSKYVPTGAYIDAPLTANVGNVDAYGDSFTQSSIFKLRYPQQAETPYTVGSAFALNGWGFGTTFYSQNRVNSQMRYPVNGNPLSIAPMDYGGDNWLNSAISDSSKVAYTASYTPRNQVNILPAYNPDAIDNTAFPTRIAYSQTKPNGSVTDEYRNFRPLDFRDLDMVAGEIVHHEICNGELLTWQQRSFQRQYFNSNGLFQNANGSEVILGDGAALSRRGAQLSSLGSKHKWSIIKGVSNGGNDVVAWVNTEYGYIIRFGYDGTNPISVIHNINGFIDKNTKWADLQFTPADDEGIHGTWNDERKEYLFTVRARKNNKGLFNPNKYYNAGDMVYSYSGSQLPDLYTAIQNTAIFIGTTVIGAPLTDASYWQLNTDAKNRNEYTLCFNELKNGFACYYSFIPRFYARWKKGYVSANPFIENILSLHNRGTIASWYNGALVSTPYLLGVVNDNPDLKKDFVAIELNSLIKPNNIGRAMEFFTEQHYSYLDIADFDSDELHDNLWASWIKNDATITAGNPAGLNDIDTSNVFGQYLLWKYYFKTGVYNKLFGVTLKLEERTRLNNS